MTISARTRQTVVDREDSCCALDGRLITGFYSLQHRRARGAGGSKAPDTDQPQNLVLLCGSGTTGHHGHVESHPTWAEHMGYRVPQGCDPSLVPIWIARIGWVLLDPDGTYQPCEDPDREVTRLLELVEQEFTELRKEGAS